ncbi:MAG: PD-(D/E)XK nuclease family protein [Bacteroidia bacterium]
MTTFIDQLIEEIKNGSEKDFSKIQVVFPTRRACLIFKNRFANHFDKPQWLPGVVSIEDFILSHSKFPLADDITLLLELYEVYVKYYPQMNVDDFYQWGKILLNDFDETDSNLVDQQKLYSTIQDLADIANMFAPGDEELQFLEDFWKSIFSSPPTDLRKNFIENWKLLPQIIIDFKKNLFDKKLLYRGLAYRTVAQQITEGKFESKFSKILFASFYALSKSEELIIKNLVEQNRAKIYWDADKYYVEDKVQEAGAYLRNNALTHLTPNPSPKERGTVAEKRLSAGEELEEGKKISSNARAKPHLSFGEGAGGEVSTGDYFNTIPKQITLTGIPLRIGQAKYLGQMLQELHDKNELDIQSTVVVLPDEQLLFPVLYGLPDCITDVNITMGFPAKNTALFSLPNSYLMLLKHKRAAKKIVYTRIEFFDFISHPFLKNYLNKHNRNFYYEWEQMQLTSVDMKTMSENFKNEIFVLLDIKVETINDLFSTLLKLLNIFLNEDKNKRSLSRIERETIKYFIDAIKNHEALLAPHLSKLSLNNGFTIIKDLVKTIRIPFTGEPVKGLQVMGFLETRVLDFERVIILSVNEDFLPAAKASKTYIPYSLRRAFGLPTDENQDAIYAYHFYRLLQRAKNIHLIYNTEVKSNGGGEPSRYLLQIEHELKNKLSNTVTVTREIISTDVVTYPDKEITIKKDDDVLKLLHEKYFKTEEQEGKSFSASSLNTYINCSLQFYFKYVAQIKEKEDFEENIDAATFGKILHGAMEHLYESGKEYNKDDIKSLYKNVDVAVNESITKEFTEAQLEGKNLLTKKIITELVNKILRNDADDVPFKILELEKEFTTQINFDENNSVVVRGFIDRFDFKDNATRILDYKSGKVDLLSGKNNSIELLFNDPKYKGVFQLYLYVLIASKNFPGQKFKAAFYHLKELNEGMKYINDENIFTQEQIDEYETLLKKMLSDIFNPEIAFTQTDDTNRCGYCGYKDICNRP